MLSGTSPPLLTFALFGERQLGGGGCGVRLGERARELCQPSSLVFVTGKSSLMAKCRLFHHLDKARFPGQRCPLRPPASQGIRLPFFVTGTQIPSRLAWCAHRRWLWARAATSMQTSRGCSLVSYSWDTRAPRGGPVLTLTACSTMVGGASPAPGASVFILKGEHITDVPSCLSHAHSLIP